MHSGYAASVIFNTVLPNVYTNCLSCLLIHFFTSSPYLLIAVLKSSLTSSLLNKLFSFNINPLIPTLLNSNMSLYILLVNLVAICILLSFIFNSTCIALTSFNPMFSWIFSIRMGMSSK
eukprot:NODE_413_length_9103_cov_0.450911.p4 type:complete len:119 gc:universal NODE_413_length_9103_cov_0.450911:3199-3555(+)